MTDTKITDKGSPTDTATDPVFILENSPQQQPPEQKEEQGEEQQAAGQDAGNGLEASSDSGFTEALQNLFCSITAYLESALNGFDADCKLATTSLLLLTWSLLFASTLLATVWVIAMFAMHHILLSLGVATLHSLAGIIILQVLMLRICWLFCKRMLHNMTFHTTRTALFGNPATETEK